MPAVEDFENRSKAFQSWLVNRGVEISPKVSIHDYRAQDQGRGMRAEADIETGELLFSIPRNAVIAVDNNPEFAELISKTLGNDEPWLALIAYLLYLQKSPEWAPYFSVLPSHFNTLMFWNSDDLQQLQGSSVVDKVGRAEAEESYSEQLSSVLQDPRFAGLDTSIDAFHRMGSLIMSYAFDISALESIAGEDEEEGAVKAMVPLADMLNAHTRLCNAHLGHPDGSGPLEMRAVKDIRKGEQIYNTYGELPNSDLIRRYGYAEIGGTETDVVEVSTEAFVSATKVLLAGSSGSIDDEVDAQLQRLKRLDDEFDIYDDSYDISSSGELDPETIMVVLFLSATTLSHELSSKSLFKAVSKLAVNGELTVEAGRIVERAVNERIQQYAEDVVSRARATPEVDFTDDVATDRARMADEVVVGEVRILLRCLEWIKDCCTSTTAQLVQSVAKKRESNADGPEAKRQHV